MAPYVYNLIMFGIGTQELLLILLIILLFFGPKKLPELARGLGQAIKELKKGFKEGLDDKDKDKQDSDNK